MIELLSQGKKYYDSLYGEDEIGMMTMVSTVTLFCCVRLPTVNIYRVPAFCPTRWIVFPICGSKSELIVWPVRDRDSPIGRAESKSDLCCDSYWKSKAVMAMSQGTRSVNRYRYAGLPEPVGAWVFGWSWSRNFYPAPTPTQCLGSIFFVSGSSEKSQSWSGSRKTLNPDPDPSYFVTLSEKKT